MSFSLDRYEPIAFHTYPDLMRAAEAQTAVLHPAAPPVPTPAPSPVAPPSPGPTPAPVEPSPESVEPSPGSVEPTPGSPSTPAPSAAAPAEPITAYLVGVDATPLLRAQLADFLDAAGSRRDVRISVGVATDREVDWVLRDQVPYGVRAMPRYPDTPSTGGARTALQAAAAAVAADAADEPARRRLVVLLWDQCPEPAELPPPLASALVLHCVDAVLSPPSVNGTGTSWLLARSRPGPRPSLLAQVGRLLEGWEAFAALPTGLVLCRGPERT